MNTEPLPSPPEPPEPPADAGGATWISDAIVAKLAALAALETDGVRGLRAERSRGWGRGPKETDHATVTVREGEASVSLRLAVADDVRIPDVVEAVRARVIARVEDATGMRVRNVDIGVVDVVADPPAQEG